MSQTNGLLPPSRRHEQSNFLKLLFVLNLQRHTLPKNLQRLRHLKCLTRSLLDHQQSIRGRQSCKTHRSHHNMGKIIRMGRVRSHTNDLKMWGISSLLDHDV